MSIKHRDIIDAFGGQAVLAVLLRHELDDEKISKEMVGQWKYRNQIPAQWWRPVVTVAKSHKLQVNGKPVTAAVLMNAKQGIA